MPAPMPGTRTRRDGYLLAVGCLFLLLPVAFPSIAVGQVDEYNGLLAQAWKCRDGGDWRGSAEYLVKAWGQRMDANGNDRFNAGLYTATSFAQRLSGQYDEALKTARYSAELFWNSTDKEAWTTSKLSLAEAATSAGDKAAAVRCLRLLGRSDATAWAWQFCATKEFDLEYSFDERHSGAAFALGMVRSFIPRNDLAYQKATYQVIGASSYEEKTKGEQRWLEVIPDGTKPFRVRCHVIISPVSFWPAIKALKGVPPCALPSNDPYLGESEGIVLNERCQEIAAPLKATDQYQTVMNAQGWCHANLDYGSADSSDSYEVLMNRRGVCDGRSRAMVSLLRANGVPARVTRGTGPVHPPGWHSWVEIRNPAGVWIPTDVGDSNYAGVQPIACDLSNLNCQVALVPLYPAVAPDSARGFPFFGVWDTALMDKVENRREYLPETAG